MACLYSSNLDEWNSWLTRWKLPIEAAIDEIALLPNSCYNLIDVYVSLSGIKSYCLWGSRTTPSISSFAILCCFADFSGARGLLSRVKNPDLLAAMWAAEDGWRARCASSSKISRSAWPFMKTTTKSRKGHIGKASCASWARKRWIIA